MTELIEVPLLKLNKGCKTTLYYTIKGKDNSIFKTKELVISFEDNITFKLDGKNTVTKPVNYFDGCSTLEQYIERIENVVY